MDENYGLLVKTYRTGKNTPVFGTYEFSSLSLSGENGPAIYVCTDATWSPVIKQDYGLTHNLDLWCRVKRSTMFSSERSFVAYQMEGN